MSEPCAALLKRISETPLTGGFADELVELASKPDVMVKSVYTVPVSSHAMVKTFLDGLDTAAAVIEREGKPSAPTDGTKYCAFPECPNRLEWPKGNGVYGMAFRVTYQSGLCTCVHHGAPYVALLELDNQ